MHGVVSSKNEENLVKRAKDGDQQAFEALLSPLQSYRRALNRKFFLPGGDKEDIDQEALLGFALALNEFQPSRGIAFHDFAMLKMRNQVVASVRKATRKKQQILSAAAPLEPRLSPGIFASSPEQLATDRSFLCALFERLKVTLSSLEMFALLHRAEGVSIKQIAGLLSLPEKTIENALFRARKKAKLTSLVLK